MPGVGVGGGAVAFTEYFMKRMNHRLKIQIERRKAGMKARRKERFALMDREKHSDGGHTRVEYECYHLCDTCGFIARAPVGPCPYCSTNAWRDLSDLSLGDDLHDLEELRRRTVSPQVHKTVASIYFFVAFVAGLVTGALTKMGYGLIIFLALTVLLLFIYPPTVRLWSVFLERFHHKRPQRWRMPLPIPNLKEAPMDIRQGTVNGDTFLQAPFTGQPCLGYKAMVLFDVEKDARPPEWAVAEVHSGDLQINNQFYKGSSVLLDIDTIFVPPEKLASRFDLKRYLRERGLFAYDGTFWLFEGIITPNENVQTNQYQGSNPVTVIQKKHATG